MKELYVLMGETSAGKSGIALSLAENLARDGHQVLYFAIEMSEREIITRGISAESKRTERETKLRAVPYTQIMSGREEKKDGNPSGIFKKVPLDEFLGAAERYFDSSISRNLHIIECGTLGTTANKICETVRAFKKKHNTDDVFVFIDYLQILSADPNDKEQRDTMQKMNIATRMLKALASQEGATIFLLSSTANDKKGERVHELSAKYSGDIGYTAGVCLGLNWEGVTTLPEGPERQSNMERDNYYGFREISIDVVKNRNGIRGKKATLWYYPSYNFVTEEEQPRDDDERDNDKQPRSFDTDILSAKTIQASQKREAEIQKNIKEISGLIGKYGKNREILLETVAVKLGKKVGQVRKMIREDCNNTFEFLVITDENGENEYITERFLDFESTIS